MGRSSNRSDRLECSRNSTTKSAIEYKTQYNQIHSQMTASLWSSWTKYSRRSTTVPVLSRYERNTTTLYGMQDQTRTMEGGNHTDTNCSENWSARHHISQHSIVRTEKRTKRKHGTITRQHTSKIHRANQRTGSDRMAATASWAMVLTMGRAARKSKGQYRRIVGMQHYHANMERTP